MGKYDHKQGIVEESRSFEGEERFYEEQGRSYEEQARFYEKQGRFCEEQGKTQSDVCSFDRFKRLFGSVSRWDFDGLRVEILKGEKFLCSITLIICFLLAHLPETNGLGSMATLAAAYDSNATICGLMAGSNQNISCWQNGTIVGAGPQGFTGLSGGKGFFCGLRQGFGYPYCWDSSNITNPKRLARQKYTSIAVGESHFCGIRDENGLVDCWREDYSSNPPENVSFSAIAAGSGFTCGIDSNNSALHCWGSISMEKAPNTSEFFYIQAGGSHACGIYGPYRQNYCWGDNSAGQTLIPNATFSELALGIRHSCGLRSDDRTVACWGDNNYGGPPENTTFASIAAGDYFTCGVLYENYSVYCWGKGFSNSGAVSLPEILPSVCEKNYSYSCPDGSYRVSNLSSNSTESICSDGYVCLSCKKCPDGYYAKQECNQDQDTQCVLGESKSPTPVPSPSPSVYPSPTSNSSKKKGLTKTEIISIVLGSFGAGLGIISFASCMWWMRFHRVKEERKIHHSVNANNGCVTISEHMKRQRSSTSMRQRSASSFNRSRSRRSAGGRPDAFSFQELAFATETFSEDNKIGAGSYGSVYRGVLADGRQVAIKRGDFHTHAKRFEKETAFQSELEFLTRLHHKHLVSLVGFCAEDEERLLVYDFMPNGTVHDHVHGLFPSSALGSWYLRIKIALQAARGIEYLHKYAEPPIIHRDIKSSNILLDTDWTARVSDFGLSLMGPLEDQSHLSLMAAGTVGYMDPEYYRLQQLSTKSDVYSFGVVLLEIITGKRAIEKQGGAGSTPSTVVDFAVPLILADELEAILDAAVEKPHGNEIEALGVMAEVAEQCVRLEGKDRPTMSDIVCRLEYAYALCKSSRKKGKAPHVEIEEIKS